MTGPLAALRRRAATGQGRPPVDPRLLRFDPAVRRHLALTVVFATVSAAALVVQAAGLAAVVARTFLGGAGLVQLRAPLGWFAAAVATHAVATWATAALGQRTSSTVKSRLRTAVLGGVARGEVEPDTDTGGLVATLTDGADAIDGTFVGYLPALARAAVVPPVLLVAAWTRDATTAVILALTLPLVPVFMVLIGLAARRATRRRFRSLTALSGQLLAVLEGLPTIRAARAVATVRHSVRTAADRLRVTTMQTLRVAFLSALVLELLSALGVATIAVFAGVRLTRGEATLEPVLFALLLAPDAFLPLRHLGQQFHANEDGAAAADRLLALLEPDEVPPVADGHRRRPAPDPARVPVRLDHLTVVHPGRATPALTDVSLTLEPGSQVAVLGPSGAGKTTLLSVLVGLHAPTAGAVRVGDVPLGDLDPDAWHARIAWVPHRPTPLRGSVREVVALGLPDDLVVADEALWRTLAEVGLDEDVRTLPQGLDTLVGSGGAQLSAGQQHRLALARALLRPAGLVVLDEPSGDLDAASERLLLAALDRFRSRRTVLVVTHRVAVAERADRVVVLDGGRLVEQGRPADLRRADGAFAGLVAASRPLEPDELRPAAPDLTPLPGASSGPGAAAPATATATSAPMLRGALRAHLRPLALAVFSGALTPVTGIALVSVSTGLIAAAAVTDNVLELMVAIVAVRALALGKAVTRYAERRAGHDVALRVVADLRTTTFDRLAERAPAGLAAHRTGDLLARVVGDLDRLQTALVRGVVPLASGTIAGAAVVAATAALFPPAAAVLAAAVVAAGLLIPAWSWWRARRPARALAAARGRLAAELVDLLAAAPELRLLGRVSPALERVQAADTAVARHDGSLAARAARADVLVQVVLGATVLALAAVGVPAVGRGTLDGVLFGAIVVLGLALAEAVAPLPVAVQSLTSARAAARRLGAVLDAPPPVDGATGSGLAVAGPLVADRVDARYPRADRDAIIGLDLVVPPGRRVAVVGRSGAGKSTIANLVVRFLDPRGGTLTLTGTDLRDLPGDDLRAIVGLTPQQAHVFAGTIADNLRLVRPGADDAALWAALRAAKVDGFVAELPRGLDTPVGERGAALSAGQRHRLALARTLLARPPVLVLDEPSADLDTITGRAFLRDALRAAGDRSVLLLTHDLRVLPVVDEVVVLDGGRPVARGRHADLLATDPGYAARWALAGPAATAG